MPRLIFCSITCATCGPAYFRISRFIMYLKQILNLSKFATCSQSQCCAVDCITLWNGPSHKMTVYICRLRSQPCTPKSRPASENPFEDIGRLSIKAFCHHINAKPSGYMRLHSLCSDSWNMLQPFQAVLAQTSPAFLPVLCFSRFCPPKGIKEDLRSRSKAREAARA